MLVPVAMLVVVGLLVQRDCLCTAVVTRVHTSVDMSTSEPWPADKPP